MIGLEKRHYLIEKNTYPKDTVLIDYSKIDGFTMEPQNNVKYDGIVVNKLVVVNPSFVEKILKKKIQRKLNLYLQFVISLLDEEDPDPSNLRNAFNDLTRYKSIIRNKYRQYLDEKYARQLLNKIAVLEEEIKSKMIYIKENQYYEDVYEDQIGRKR